MVDSAEGNAPKDSSQARPEGGSAPLTIEDAERFAEAFVPSWQFDQAPFTPGVMSQEEIERLAAASSPVPMPVAPSGAPFSDELTASDVDISPLLGSSPSQSFAVAGAPPAAPPPAALAPLPPPPAPPAAPVSPSLSPKGTLMMAGGPPLQTRPAAEGRASRPAPKPRPSSQPAPASRAPAAPRNGSAQRAAAPAVPVKPSEEDTARLLLKRPSRGPFILGGVGVVAVIAIVIGLRAMSHGEEPSGIAGPTASPPAAAAAAATTARADDIPPPPPPADPTPPAQPAATNGAPVVPTPVNQAPAPVAAPLAAPLAPAPRPAQAPAPHPVVAAPPPPRPPPPAARPASPPTQAKTTTKPSGGGIVRDNPF
jgi:hypothetical protein